MIDAHVMWSIGQIATRDGISRQAVSKTVKSFLENHGMPVERDGRGRVATVSLAHYDHLRSQFANPAKASMPPEPEQAEAEPEAPKAIREKDSFDEARRQAEWLKVDRERLRRQEELGQLVRKDVLADALALAGREIQSLISRLPNNADDLSLAVSKDGAHGLRLALRDIAFRMNSDIADRMVAVLAEAPKVDPLIENEN